VERNRFDRSRLTKGPIRNDINQHTTELGVAIAVIGLCAMVLALYLGAQYGWIHN
jgi:hypothetical protein